MVQPVIPPYGIEARIRQVTPDALAAAYRALYPGMSQITDPSKFAAAWLDKCAADPVSHISTKGDSQRLTTAFYKALEIPLPKTDEMAQFVLMNPDMEKMQAQLCYVSARTPGGDNVDLIVRAVSREHAEVTWREHFDGWDLPARPNAIAPIPVDGTLGAIPWNLLTSEPEDETPEEEESQIPSL
ncbi:hypothetical protein ACFPOU_17120 [Massilia jejuensis]|uniref:Uncharacterized protein n=1 Tax=Massilia jejuensis TaxID=648894 RepID=A0ABW0PMF4_9BURK